MTDLTEKELAKSSAEVAFKLMSGSNSGFASKLMRVFLAFAEIGYIGIIKTRYGLYRIGLKRTRKVAAPVISVGNLSTGGTGKTPMVEWLASHIHSTLGKKVAVISRGYKTHHVFGKDGEVTELNDESMQFLENCPDGVMIQNVKRYLGATDAIENHGANVIVLDDGFQHRQLHRDLDIVLIDSMLPFGFDHVLPRGLLREPLSGLKRADIIIITRQSAVSESEIDDLRERLQTLAPGVPVCTADHQPVELENIATGEILPVETLKDKRAYLISGIANPTAFRVTVSKLGATVVFHSSMEDHYMFTEEDVAGFSNAELKGAVDYFVVTQKDAVKLKTMFDIKAIAPVLSLKIRLSINEGLNDLQSLVQRSIQKGV